MIVQREPAIVVTPTQPLWLQAYPHGYPSGKQKTYPLAGIPRSTPAFHIPKSWFAKTKARANPWTCKPTKLPCGKAHTDYWACVKEGGKD